MATVASIVANLRANTGQFDKALDGAKRRLKEVQTYTQQLQARETAAANARKSAFADERREQMHAARAGQANTTLGMLAQMETSSAPVKIQQATKSFHEMNNELKMILGRGSAFKDVLEIATGGGAIVGLNLLANAIGNIGTSLSEMAKASVSVGANMNEMATKFVQSIPVIGGVHNAVKGVYDFFDAAINGENAEVNQQAMRDKQKRRNDFEAGGSNDAGYRMREAQVGAFLAVPGRTDQEKILARVNAENERLHIALEKNLDEIADTLGRGTAAFERRRAEETAITQVLQNANSTNAREEIRSLQEETDKRIQDAIVKGFQSKWDAITHLANKAGRAGSAAASRIIGAVEARIEQDAERRQVEAQRKVDEAAARRRSFIGGAAGFFDRLKSIEAQPIRFSGAAEKGSQEEFAARQQSIFAGSVVKKDETELLKQSVELEKKQLSEEKRIADAIGNLYDKLGLKDIK